MVVIIGVSVFWAAKLRRYEKELGKRLTLNDLPRVQSSAHTRRKALETSGFIFVGVLQCVVISTHPPKGTGDNQATLSPKPM